MPTKTVTLRLPEAVYKELKEAAMAAHRPLSNLIETAALSKIREDRFADDVEMAEINENERLRKRLSAGSTDARKRRGQFVD